MENTSNSPKKLFTTFWKYKKTQKVKLKNTVIDKLIELDAEKYLRDIYKFDNSFTQIFNYLFEKYKFSSSNLKGLYNRTKNKTRKRKIILRLHDIEDRIEFFKYIKKREPNLYNTKLIEENINKPNELFNIYLKHKKLSPEHKKKIVKQLIKIDAESYLIKIYKYNNKSCRVFDYLFEKFSKIPLKLLVLYQKFTKYENKNKIIISIR